MPRNGSGTYSLPQPPFVAGTVISSAAVNSDFSDIATALTGSLPRDGQAGMQGQFKATDGSSASPSITFTSETTTGFHRAGSGIIGVTLVGTELGTFTSAGWSGGVSGKGAAPIASILDFAGSSAPSFWLLCFGQAISRTTYSALFGVIGTTYGPGDGSTTFNVPDLRGRVTAGVDNMGGVAAGRLTVTYFGGNASILGTTGGLESHTLITAEIPSHTHANSLNDPGHLHGGVLAHAGINAAAGVNPASPPDYVSAGTTNTAAAVTGMTITNAAQGGGGAHAIVQPTIVLNKIIYVGV